MTDISKEAVERLAIHTHKACKCEYDDLDVSATLRAQAARIEQLEAGTPSQREIDAVREENIRLTADLATARNDALREAEALCDAMRVEAVESNCHQIALGAAACRRKIHRLLPIQIVGSSDVAKETP